MAFIEEKTSKNNMMSIIERIYPFRRIINSEGMNQAIEVIKNEFADIIVHEYPVGSVCEDWEVPYSWKVIDGTMTNKAGKKIASIEDNQLFVVDYSESVDGWFTKEEISNHLTTDSKRPDDYLFDHRLAYDYNLSNWKISLPYNMWNSLDDGQYHIKIISEKGKNSMKVAEVFLQGKFDTTITFIAHLDELCNDDLSGCAVISELMRNLEKKKNRNYSYQMLLVPETIGTIFYTYNNYYKLKNVIGVIDIETVGAGDELYFTRAFTKNSYVEKITRKVLDKMKIDYKESDFFQPPGNDERIFEWPNIKIPSVSLLRWPFQHYHSGSDTPLVINEDFLLETLKILESFVELIEKNYKPIWKNITPPWLSKHKLYYDYGKNFENEIASKINNELFYNINGKNSISDLEDITGLDFNSVFHYLEKLYNKGFIIKNYDNI